MKNYYSKIKIIIEKIFYFFKNEKNEIKNLNSYETMNYEFEVLKDKDGLSFSDVITRILNREYVDMEDFFKGYTDKEIANLGIKVYQFQDIFIKCDIKKNIEKNRYEIYLDDYTLVGFLDNKYDEILDDIIKNNRKMLYGSGLIFDEGRYKYYDESQEKVIIKSSKYKAKVIIKYEIPK